jgi:PPP family 3-phenylpropionic acid transporter
MQSLQRLTPDVSTPKQTVKEISMMRLFSFFVYSTMGVVVSHFPLYFSDRGFNGQQIGFLYSIGPAVSIFANLLIGIASDKYRTVKKLLSLLLLGQLIAIALLFPATDYFWVCLIMASFYFFQTPVNPLNDSLILLSVPHTGRNYPSIRIYGSIGFSCSAVISGLFLTKYGSETTMAICLITIGVSLGLSFLLRDYQGSVKKIQFSGFYKLIRKPELLTFFFFTMVMSVALRMNEGFLGITMREMGASQAMVGTAWMVSSASEIPILYLLGKFGHKFKDLPLLVFAGLVYAFRFWLISEMNDPSWAIYIQALHSLSFGVFFATALRYMTNIIPDEYRASGQAIYSVVWIGFGGLISGTAGGYLFEHLSRQHFFQTAMALSLFGSLGFLFKHWREKPV